jgi:hypothetical protein
MVDIHPSFERMSDRELNQYITRSTLKRWTLTRYSNAMTVVVDMLTEDGSYFQFELTRPSRRRALEAACREIYFIRGEHFYADELRRDTIQSRLQELSSQVPTDSGDGESER